MAVLHQSQAANEPVPSLVRETDRPPYLNRELSWLDFNQRVLDQALSDDHPLLERVKFLSIVGSNLDEFFMVRVAALVRASREVPDWVSLDGTTPAQRLAAIRRRTALMMRDQAACWRDRLRPALAEHRVQFLDPPEYTSKVRDELHAFFRSDIFPLLTPLALGPGHPFPFISNRSKNFAIVVRDGLRTRFARLKIPDILPRFIPLPGSSRREWRFAYIEDIIRLNLTDLFPGIEVVGAHLFRVLRDFDIDVQDQDGDDLMERVDKTLKERRRAAPSLLQIEASMPRKVENLLVENLEVEHGVVSRSAERLDFADWMAIHRLPLPRLKDRPLPSRRIWAASGSCIFDDLRESDRLVHHPFDSFSAVEAFVEQASTDPRVVGIKMTLYRIGSDSPLIDMLTAAAEEGKQVAALVELTARFDEQLNIKWATRLEAAGVHVVYGIEDLKTHCKLCLVVRKEEDGIRRYAHIGTGNYNRVTSQLYTDLGLFTADPDLVSDVSEVFNYLTGYSRRTEYAQLLVAPVNLRQRLDALIDREIRHAEAGRRGRIIIKINTLSDPAMVRSLYRASQAGVEVDLLVRGVCCLRPGVRGLSERIRVRSIVGRYLEHSRIFYFSNDGDPDVYMGSADLMERNLDRRIEASCRVRDPAIVGYLHDVVLDAYLRDTRRAYVQIDKKYERAAPVPGEPSIDAQVLLHARPAHYDLDTAPLDGTHRACSDAPEEPGESRS